MTPRCRHLRWKSVARDDDDPVALYASMLRRQCPFTCARTLQAWGPDDDLVSPEECARQRPCFAALDDVPKR
jgi:hypothetical protein